jgi:hypothetical protein
MTNAKILRGFLAASTIALGSAVSHAAWEQTSFDIGGLPGGNLAISSKTSLAYIPILQQKALVTFDGEKSTRLDFDIKPTSIGYSAATGQVFVVGGFDNAVVVLDEATGTRTRLALGTFPSSILVDDVRGKAYTPNWGGIGGQGSLSIIDSRALTVRTVSLSGYVSSFVQDRATGNLFVVVDRHGEGTALLALDADGNLLAREPLGYQAYSLAVDSRTGHVYSAGLSHAPYLDVDTVERIFRVFAQPGLQLVTKHVWPAGRDWYKLNFVVDPEKPGLYFSSGGNTALFRVNAAGHDLEMWNLPLGTTTLYDGRTVANGIFGLDPDPATGNLFLSSPIGQFFAEFNPRTGVTEMTTIPGAVGFSGVQFWPDSSRVLVLDGAADFQLTILRRKASPE